jgi:hypothetical protein
MIEQPVRNCMYFLIDAAAIWSARTATTPEQDDFRPVGPKSESCSELNS